MELFGVESCFHGLTEKMVRFNFDAKYCCISWICTYVWNHIYVDQNNSFAVQNWDLSRACVRCCYKKIPSAKCFLHIVWWLVSNKSEIHSIHIKCVPSFWNFLWCMKPLFLYSVVWNTVYVRLNCRHTLYKTYYVIVMVYVYVEVPFTY